MLTELSPLSSTIEEYEKTAAALVELESRYKGVRYDVVTKLGMLAATVARKELRTLRVALEHKRVEIKAPALKRSQEIDTEARRLTAAIAALESPIDEQIKEEETRKEQERLAVERAEQERLDAIQRAIRDAEQQKIDEANAEIMRRQAELNRAEQARQEAEAAQARALEVAARAFRLRIEEEERQARLLREEQDRLARQEREDAARIARGIQEARELELQQERNKIDADRRIVESAQRKAREEEELKARQERERIEAMQRAAEEKQRNAKEKEDEKQREIQRRANAVLDARVMLKTFVQRFGQLEEFAPVVSVITTFLK